MNKASKLKGLLPRILTFLFIIPLLGVNLAMAYIIFAPDSMPKPFYLMYYLPTPSAEHAGSEPSLIDPQTAHAAAPSEEPASGSSEHSSTAPKAQLEIRPGQGIMVDTGTKIVNLIDPTGRRYLRVGIVLEYAPTDLGYYTMEGEERTLFLEEFHTEIQSMLPVINDVIITSLSTQTFETVYTADGKEALRASIMQTINSQLLEHHVVFVYFTEFVVQ